MRDQRQDNITVESIKMHVDGTEHLKTLNSLQAMTGLFIARTGGRPACSGTDEVPWPKLC